MDTPILARSKDKIFCKKKELHKYTEVCKCCRHMSNCKDYQEYKHPCLFEKCKYKRCISYKQY